MVKEIARIVTNYSERKADHMKQRHVYMCHHQLLQCKIFIEALQYASGHCILDEWCMRAKLIYFSANYFEYKMRICNSSEANKIFIR